MLLLEGTKKFVAIITGHLNFWSSVNSSKLNITRFINKISLNVCTYSNKGQKGVHLKTLSFMPVQMIYCKK